MQWNHTNVRKCYYRYYCYPCNDPKRKALTLTLTPNPNPNPNPSPNPNPNPSPNPNPNPSPSPNPNPNPNPSPNHASHRPVIATEIFLPRFFALIGQFLYWFQLVWVHLCNICPIHCYRCNWPMCFWQSSKVRFSREVKYGHNVTKT